MKKEQGLAWEKAWYEHVNSQDINEPMIKSHFFKAYRLGYTAALSSKNDKVQILRGALELLLAKEDKFGRLRQFQGEIVLSPQELEFARAALKSYDQTDEGV